jgi:alginate O-acetyltransferase complex protein AlgI
MFYFTTSGELTFVLLLSVGFNWVLSLRLAQIPNKQSMRRPVLILGIVVNIVPLLYYKYAIFFLSVLKDTFSFWGLQIDTPAIDPPLPIGISFFTFQAISYIADIATCRVAPARGLVEFGMYHSCFPQLIAGPIVRYEEIVTEVTDRKRTLHDVHNGIIQFCFGLGKKAILADTVGRIADAVFLLPDANRGFAAAWLGIIAYSLQIYFDFSGYSDMAIGLARMLGFHFPENFNQPYLSRSVTEFWRRWHLTLSRWFRDYVYIPLGGNRQGTLSTFRNLLIVFFLCGLWHGAAYTFVIWGLFHGGVLIIERISRSLTNWRPPAIISWGYTMIAVMSAWVFFRAYTPTKAVGYLTDMFSLQSLYLPDQLVSDLTLDRIFYFAIAAILAVTPYRWFFRFDGNRYTFGATASFASLLVALLAIVVMSVNGFSPFIYFRF